MDKKSQNKHQLRNLIWSIHGKKSAEAECLIKSLPKDTEQLLEEAGWPQSGFYRDYALFQITPIDFYEFVKEVHKRYA